MTQSVILDFAEAPVGVGPSAHPFRVAIMIKPSSSVRQINPQFRLLEMSTGRARSTLLLQLDSPEGSIFTRTRGPTDAAVEFVEVPTNAGKSSGEGDAFLRPSLPLCSRCIWVGAVRLLVRNPFGR